MSMLDDSDDDDDFVMRFVSDRLKAKVRAEGECFALGRNSRIGQK